MKFKKALAVIMCASMVCASLTGCDSKEIKTSASIEVDEANDKVYEDIEDQELETVVKHIANAGSSSASKQETVYVKTNPNGVVDSVVVSNWLKNIDNTEELVDSSDLKDITKVMNHTRLTKTVITSGKVTAMIYIIREQPIKNFPLMYISHINLTVILSQPKILPERAAMLR